MKFLHLLFISTIFLLSCNNENTTSSTPSQLTESNPSKTNQIPLIKLLNKELITSLNDYQHLWQQVDSSDALASIYFLGKKIQTPINDILKQKISVKNAHELPDLSALENAMIGFQNSLIAQGKQFHFFIDYKKMYAKALTTKGTADDDFFNFQFKVNEVDSIEHFSKSWIIETSDLKKYSLLGRGKHLQLLNEIDILLQKKTLFEQPILEIKEEIIQDILGNQQGYWEATDKIIDELDNIIDASFAFMTKENLIAIKTRKAMFKSSKENKIPTNKRAF